jgi:Tol biopolymer transport system component
MALAPGARLGPYEIVAAAGSGGMGEIYRARDTRLGREVAIKVLPQHLSADAGRRERFEREARAVSSLNHPNICVLHDIGHQEGVDYLVLELLEGETVADRLLRGALPIDQVMRAATEIASALARAHRQGIVHRDLKPQNVMLTKTGAKLLDFGLAKLREGESDGAAAPGAGASGGARPGGTPPGGSMLPTATRNLTTAGTLLGTFQYMAPEQLEGKEADARTDIFAFGALLYEMASGRRAFEGGSQASLIAAIMGKEPVPLAQVAPLAPAPLDRIVRRCLAKDPDDRWQSASDLAHELREVAGAAAIPVPATSAPSGVHAGAPPAKRRRVFGLAAAAGIAVVAAAVTAAAMYVTRPRPVAPAPLRANLILPTGMRLAGQDGGLSLSPDGRILVIVGSRAEGERMLHVRRLDSVETQPLAGTEGASYPFWSPDGRFIGFFSGHKLRKVPAAGGTVVTLCDAQDGRGGTWGRRGDIVFAPSAFGGLLRVDERGGTPAPVTTTDDPTVSHRLPWFLPDGKRLLFFSGTSVVTERNSIAVFDLDTKKVTPLLNVNSGGRYVAPGWLVFVRDRNLMAQRFDPVTLRLGGEAAPIVERIRFNPNRWTGSFALSDTGLLVSQSGSLAPRSRLSWFDLDGKPLGTFGSSFEGFGVEMAPDGKRAVVTQVPADGVPQLWMYDLARGLGTRFTFGTSAAIYPVFSPDSRRVAFGDSEGRILEKDVDGSADARPVIETQDVIRQPTAWTPDGRFIVYRGQGAGTGWGISRVAAIRGGEQQTLVDGPADENYAHVSADGRWLAYESNESGETSQLYIVPFDNPKGRKYQVTSEGVRSVSWMPRGLGILYQTAERRMRVIEITPSGDGLAIGAARPVFGDKAAPTDWTLHPDGRRILALVPESADVEPPLALVTDWATGLEAR